VIIPEENRRNLEEVPDNIKANLDIHPVKWIDEVLDIALVSKPQPLTDEEVMAIVKSNEGDKCNNLQTH
jgi:ATP-dependent Lon protease